MTCEPMLKGLVVLESTSGVDVNLHSASWTIVLGQFPRTGHAGAGRPLHRSGRARRRWRPVAAESSAG